MVTEVKEEVEARVKTTYPQQVVLRLLGASVFAALAWIMFRMADQSPAHETFDTAVGWGFVGVAFGNAVLCLINYARSRRHDA